MTLGKSFVKRIGMLSIGIRDKNSKMFSIQSVKSLPKMLFPTHTPNCKRSEEFHMIFHISIKHVKNAVIKIAIR